MQLGTDVDAATFVRSLGGDAVPDGELRALADLTALRRTEDGTYYESNYDRGCILYALVATRRPAVALEFGTGRGYGAAAMALAMVDHRVAGSVYTIDMVAHDREFEWSFRDRQGVRTERWSRARFWQHFLRRDVRERIVPLTGDSSTVARRWQSRALPRVDIAFVDGGHDHATARHDLLAACALSTAGLGLLVDDVVERPGFGVARAIRELFPERLVSRIAARWGPDAPAGSMAWIDLRGQEGERTRLAGLYQRERSWWRRLVG